MIRPTKYMDLDSSVIRISSVVLNEVSKSRLLTLNELESTIIEVIGETSRLNLLPSLNFLFLAGKLDYDLDTDAIIYVTDNGKGN